MAASSRRRATITGRVAQVLNEYEVAFTIGRTKGVRPDDIADVVKRTKIVDPFTKEGLGEVLETLVSTRIFLVEAKFSIGRTYQGYPGPNLINLVVAGRTNRQTVSPVPVPATAFGPIYVPVGAEVVIQPALPTDAAKNDAPK